MLLHIHPDNPQDRLIDQAVDVLKKGGVIIYPTDTLYAFGCSIMSKKAVSRVCQLKGMDPDKANLSCVCRDLKDAATYTIQVSNPVFQVMRKVLPGPYTFILKASKEVPRHFQSRRKTVGIRIVDHPITEILLERLGHPLLSTSVPLDPDAYWVDTQAMYDRWGNQVDLMIEGGEGGLVPSTVLNCSEGDFEIVREGKGPIEDL
jgi:tRNA threonylcarbamoyl adenosine modification protein (Sua5/YciO/YrdC/YwlC family)